MNEDPKLFDAGDYNLFRYCSNDPLDKTDPMGTYAIGPGFTEEQKKQLQQAQKAEAQRLQSAVTRISDALKAGKDSKEFKSLNKDFKDVFHKEATRENLAKVTRDANREITA